MNIIAAYIKWIMLVSGVLTCTMAYAAFAPQAALQSTFGESLEGPLATVVVRNWAVLITLMRGMLVYGAFVPAVRNLALFTAGLSKAVFVALIFSQGGRFLAHQAGTAAAIDAGWVIIFSLYLLRARGAES